MEFANECGRLVDVGQGSHRKFGPDGGGVGLWGGATSGGRERSKMGQKGQNGL
jgi:hypothetical protein